MTSEEVLDKIKILGTHEANTIQQMIRACLHESVVAGVLCADGHKGYGVPIGGVLAYQDAISPSGVGYDIGCGNKAVLTDMLGDDLRRDIKTIMDDIWRTISFGIGQKNGTMVDHPLMEKDSHPGWELQIAKDLKRRAAGQLGTIGSGNHYVDLFTDEFDRVWIGVHFGSRGLGWNIANWFLKKAGGIDDMDSVPIVFEKGSALFDDYIAGMELGGAYAYAGRDWVCQRVASILGARILEEIHNHHNYAWEETHFGEKLWVVRKGATPAFPGQKGFVGGTMSEQAVILEGVESSESQFNLYSTVHGAGRIMGRKQATGVIKFNKATQERRVVREPLITQEMMDSVVHAAGVELRGAGVDESPQCYKRLPDVLAAHAGSVKILHRLTPVGVAMAGKEEHDPFKD